MEETSKRVRFKISVQPRASRNEISGWQGDALKIRLTAPPVDGEANEACLKFIANYFQVSRKQVSIASGLKSKHKIIEIQGLSEVEFRQYLNDI